MLYLTANWLKIVKEQGFIPSSFDESNSDEESDEYETGSESESDGNDNYDAYPNGNIGSYNEDFNHNCSDIDIIGTNNEFVVEDPFCEVNDDDIEYVDDDSKHETHSIHLKNGFILCGTFRKKRRIGIGSLTGAPLEEKGINP